MGLKTPFYVNFSLSAKFNRFFIILGGGYPPYTGKMGNFDRKTKKNADEVSGFLTVFLVRGYTGGRPLYTGKSGNFKEIRVKNAIFDGF